MADETDMTVGDAVVQLDKLAEHYESLSRWIEVSGVTGNYARAIRVVLDALAESGKDTERLRADVEEPAVLRAPDGVNPHAWRMGGEYRTLLNSGSYLTPETHCPRCVAAGHPDHYASPRTCGFSRDGKFRARNWSCATLDELRRIAYESNHATRWNDASVAVLPLEYGFVVLSYYKDRGCTDRAYRSDDCTPITLDDAEEAIRCGVDFVAAFAGSPVSERGEG